MIKGPVPCSLICTDQTQSSPNLINMLRVYNLSQAPKPAISPRFILHLIIFMGVFSDTHNILFSFIILMRFLYLFFQCKTNTFEGYLCGEIFDNLCEN